MDVLVIDKLQATRELLQMVLDLMGYDVTTAAEGATALSYLRRGSRPTIVVLDARLPDIGGIDFLERIASDPRLAYGNAYLLMVDQQDGLHDHAYRVLSALGVPILFKPFDLDALFEAVAHLSRRVRSNAMRSGTSGMASRMASRMSGAAHFTRATRRARRLSTFPWSSRRRQQPGRRRARGSVRCG
jgi:DNA-binding response OmpR family regulator